MVQVYLKAKTFDELIIKMTMMNTLSGREYQFNNSFYAKNEFYVTFKSDVPTWKRVNAIIEKRFKEKVKVKNVEK